MIKAYTLKSVEKALNHALSLDEASSEKIGQLSGKVIEIEVAPLGVIFFIKVQDDRLTLLPEYHEEIHTKIRSSPLGMIRLSILPASSVRSLFNDQVEISGDVALGQDLKRLFEELDIDWEGHLSRFTGDVVAYQVGSVVRKGHAFGKRLTSSFRQNLTEYLQEEVRFFPPREEVEDFFKDVDDIALRVERLEAQFSLMRADENN